MGQIVTFTTVTIGLHIKLIIHTIVIRLVKLKWPEKGKIIFYCSKKIL